VKYRKLPVVIDAIQWKGNNLFEVVSFISGEPNISTSISAAKWDDYVNIVRRDGLIIKTLEGQHLASIGDFIIKGVHGENYPCKPDIFAKTYEPA